MMFSMDAEQAVLGGVMLSNDALDAIPWLSADHFYRSDHRAVFDEVLRLHAAGQGVDVVTLSNRMGRDSDITIGYLHDLVSHTPSAANIVHYAGIVRDFAQRRSLAALASEVSEQVAESKSPRSVVDFAQSGLEKIVSETITTDPVRSADDVDRYRIDFKKRAAGEGPKAIPTGFLDLDEQLGGGLRGGQLVILAGRPKMGKTALALNIALNMSSSHSGLFNSLEMPRDELTDRCIAVIGKIPLRKVIDPRQMSEKDWSLFEYATTQFGQRKLSFDDQGALTLMDVRAKARMTKRRHGLDFLFIDYLQLMDGEGDSRNTQIEGITRGLKGLAKELDIPIVLLSQLNRGLEQRPNKRPMPSDLRDSGAIEQDCDIAMFVYRDEVYNQNSADQGICEVSIPLIRQGAPGTVGLTYINYLTKFENLEQGREFGRSSSRPRYASLKD